MFNNRDSKVTGYNRNEIMKILEKNACHSPEESETDLENNGGKRRIVVYDYTWRSDEVCDFYVYFIFFWLFTLFISNFFYFVI